MPTYDYRCSTTGAVYEARHAMSMEIQTWAELCACTGLEPGSTPADGPVERLANGGAVVQSRSLKNPELAPCGRSSGCGYGSNGGGGCGF
tara:strand:+ start:7396 stop:7665 length:270 start_codon:yes stop_codon:yes gene_type:complete